MLRHRHEIVGRMHQQALDPLFPELEVLVSEYDVVILAVVGAVRFEDEQVFGVHVDLLEADH